MCVMKKTTYLVNDHGVHSFTVDGDSHRSIAVGASVPLLWSQSREQRVYGFESIVNIPLDSKPRPSTTWNYNQSICFFYYDQGTNVHSHSERFDLRRRL